MESIGLDTGAVDGNSPPDYAAAHAAGANWTYLKKAEATIHDAFYARDAEPARKAGLTVGAYLLPRKGPHFTATPKEQVAAFKSVAGDIIPNVDLPPAVDCEFPGGVAATGCSPAELVEFMRQVVFEMHDAFGCWPVFYTSFNQWWDLRLPAAPWAANCALWLKTAYHLPRLRAPDQSTPYTPHFGPDQHDPRDYFRGPDPWKNAGWVAQQYQGDAVGFAGLNKTCDLSRFNVQRPGDQGGFVSWLKPRFVIDPAPRAIPTYDSAMEAGVAALQSARGLTVDKVIGPATFAAAAWL